MRPGDRVTLAGRTLTYRQEQQERIVNYTALRSQFEVVDAQGRHTPLTPEIRYFPTHDRTTSEAAIHSTAFYDLYAVTGTNPGNTTLTLRAYFTPLMLCVWAGCLLMAGAGILSWIQAIRRNRHG